MTDKEIIRALRICATHKDKGCGLCPQMKYVRCTERLADEAITMIERLTAENVVLPDGQASAIESLRKEIEWKDMVIALAQKEQAEAEAESQPEEASGTEPDTEGAEAAPAEDPTAAAAEQQ